MGAGLILPRGGIQGGWRGDTSIETEHRAVKREDAGLSTRVLPADA